MGWIAHIGRAREIGSNLGHGLDRIYAGTWLWRRRQANAQRALDRALEEEDERSPRVRHAAETEKSAYFAARFWRDGEAPVRRVVGVAEDAGVPLAALRLLILNRDIRLSPEGVTVRRSRGIALLAYGSAALIGTHWFLMLVLCLSGDAPLGVRIAATCVVTAVYAVLYRGWSLYLTRACDAVRTHGERIEAIIACTAADQSAAVLPFPSQRGTR
jgi:hypothetical protein